MTTSDNHYKNTFTSRHIGPSKDDIAAMLKTIDQESLDTLIKAVVPSAIRSSEPLNIGDSKGEKELDTLTFLKLVKKNIKTNLLNNHIEN